MNEFRLQKYKLSMQNNCTPKEKLQFMEDFACFKTEHHLFYTFPPKTDKNVRAYWILYMPYDSITMPFFQRINNQPKYVFYVQFHFS